MNSRGGDGAEVIYALRGTDELPNLILEKLQNKGQNIRKSYTRTLPTNPRQDYYFMLRNTGNTDAIIVEYGFLDSNKDDVNQLKNNWQEYAEAAVEAIAEYLDLPYNGNMYNTYTVKSGDSLWSIAKRFNTTVGELKNLNNLTSNLLSIGQQLKLPLSDDNTYIVKSGDTLYSIAQQYNLTVNELKKLNNLTSNLLTVGQKLVIGANNITNNNYIVKPGDTLYSIANLYNTSVNNLKTLNDLTTDFLNIGQELKVPIN